MTGNILNVAFWISGNTNPMDNIQVIQISIVHSQLNLVIRSIGLCIFWVKLHLIRLNKQFVKINIHFTSAYALIQDFCISTTMHNICISWFIYIVVRKYV